MTQRSGLRLVFCVAAILPATAVHADTTFKILATKHNPTCGRRGSPHFGERCGVNSECDSTPGQGDGLCIGGIVPTNTLNVEIGDIIVTEVFVSDWSPNGETFRTYQFKYDLASFFDDCPGGISGYKWNRREECKNCASHDDCPDGEICGPSFQCQPNDHEPELGMMIDTDRLDWVFYGFPRIIYAFEACTLTFGATLIVPPGPAYDGTPKYLGTMVLQVNPDSAGEYIVSLSARDATGTFDTFLIDRNRVPLLPFILEPLTLVSPGINGHCGGCWADDSNPPHCSIDARQTFEPDGSALGHGSDSISIEFSDIFGPPCYSPPQVDDFVVRQVPFGNPPRISSVDWDDATSTATINFDRRISPQEWTCVSYTGREPYTEFCVGYLPGDVDGDGSSNATDILRVIDNLNGLVDPPYAIWQCDVDRSGVCSASDILRVIDLLNGADQYDIWLGATIDTCPDPWWRE